MGFSSNDDNENDLPDWLKGLRSEGESDAFEADESKERHRGRGQRHLQGIKR